MPIGRIAVCSWSLEPQGPQDVIDHCRILDIPNLQLALSPIVAENSTRVWRDAIDTLRRAGLRIVSGMMEAVGEDYSTLDSIARTGGVRPDETWPANLSHAAAIAELAKDADIELVTFHAGFIPEHHTGDETSENPQRIALLDRIETIADLFAERDINLGLETGQETAEDLESALREMDRPNIGVNFDPANMILYGMGDPVDALRRLAPRIMQIHVKDAVPAARKGEWGTEVPVGRGKVDWERFFDIALALDPPVKFIIERESGSERLKDIRRARNFIIDHLAQL